MNRRQRSSSSWTAILVAALLALPAPRAQAQTQPACDPNVSPGCDPGAPVLTTPPPAPYPYPYPVYQPQSPPYAEVPSHYEPRRRWGLFAGGLATFGAMYTMTVLAAAASRDGVAAIPVVGPFIEIANYRSRFDCANPPLGSVYYCRAENSGDQMLYGILIVDGLVQAAGLAMAAAGLLTTQQVRVWDVKMTLLPSVTPNGGGVSAFGTF